MAQYDVYGLGNALVDIECEVSAATLASLGMDKGVMTLLDEAIQAKAIAHLDGCSKKLSGGGSAANTLIAVSQLGGKTFYTCRVANDEYGHFYSEDLKRCGVETTLAQALLEPSPTGVTGKCLVLVTPDADRTMGTFLGISAQLTEADVVTAAVQAATYTYLEGYLVSGENSKRAALKAREIAQAAGRKVALSLSDLNMVKFFKSGLLEMIGSGVDLLFANESEALLMAETADLGEAIAHLKTLANTFAITRGPQGSVLFDGAQLIDIAPVPVRAIDTNGAGDMYAGAVLYGLTHDLGWETAGRLGSRAAAELVTSLGARMATEALQVILKEVRS